MASCYCKTMIADADPAAWLETASSERLPLDATTSLGRSQTLNRYGFASDKVSRRHALIHAQDGGEFWLVDLGSTNGTAINDDRVVGSVRLRDGDRVNLGNGVDLLFRQPVSAEDRRAQSMQQKTVADAREEQRWLLIADLADSSELSKTMPATQLALTVGEWLAPATELLGSHGGRINKYMGDGFLAFWRDQPAAPAAVAAALAGFRDLQSRALLQFRIVVHRGTVAVGGTPTLGEESLLSDDLSFAFRLEKLADSLGLPFLLSLAAAQCLVEHLTTVPVPGRHDIKGFPPVEGLATITAA